MEDCIIFILILTIIKFFYLNFNLRKEINDVYENNISEPKVYKKIEQLSHLINQISSPSIDSDRFAVHNNVLYRIHPSVIESNELHDKYVIKF